VNVGRLIRLMTEEVYPVWSGAKDRRHAAASYSPRASKRRRSESARPAA
jgi:hypothetical protein